MPVSNFTLPTATDGNFTVLGRIAAAFAPHQTAPSSMSLAFDPGALMAGGQLIEVGAQTSVALTAPIANPRIDRAVLDPASGTISIVTGSESASPVPPALPVGRLPIARVQLNVGIGSITNALITDERVPTSAGATGALINVQRFISSGSYSATPGTGKVLVKIVGGGGSGGSCAATSGGQVSCASGGGAGAYAEAWLTSGFNSVAITVGGGGAPSAPGNNAGNPGGASSFGSTVVAPGGTPGYGSPATAPPLLWGGTGVSALPTGGNLVSAAGTTGAEGFGLASTVVVGGIGGCSVFGGGGRGAGWGDGFPAQAPGAGGGGACAIASQPAFKGGPGAAGTVLVYEYA